VPKVEDYGADKDSKIPGQQHEEVMPSLKIRIKMGETATIVKSTSVPCSLDKKDRTFNNGGHHLPPVIESLVENSPDLATLAAKRPKKPRQKRQMDDFLLVAGGASTDPLQMISHGMPLPKLKSTADLVAEMASNYPEEMARSITNAATASSSSMAIVDDDVITKNHHHRPLVNGCYDSMDSSDSYSNNQPSSNKYADYLNVTKAELVAKFLKSSTDAEEFTVAGDDVTDAGLVMKQSPEWIIDDDEDRKDPLWTAEQKSLKAGGKCGDKKSISIFDLDQSARDDEMTQNLNKPKIIPSRPKHDWYSILKPLGDDDVISKDDKTYTGKLLDRSIDEDIIGARNPPDDVISLHSRLLVSFADDGQSSKNVDRSSKNSSIPVLAMPYVDIGLPDFLEYKYPEKQRHLAHWSER